MDTDKTLKDKSTSSTTTNDDAAAAAAAASVGDELANDDSTTNVVDGETSSMLVKKLSTIFFAQHFTQNRFFRKPEINGSGNGEDLVKVVKILFLRFP